MIDIEEHPLGKTYSYVFNFIFDYMNKNYTGITDLCVIRISPSIDIHVTRRSDELLDIMYFDTKHSPKLEITFYTSFMKYTTVHVHLHNGGVMYQIVNSYDKYQGLIYTIIQVLMEHFKIASV